MIKLIILLVSIAAVAHGQVPSAGNCPTNIPVKNPMNWALYSGKWYTNANTRSWMDLTGKCMTNFYKDLPLSNATLTNFQYNMTGPSNTTHIGSLAFPSNTNGEYTAYFNGIPLGQGLKVQIVDTDYTSCAVAYGCYQFPFVSYKLEFVWVKTRDRFAFFGLNAVCENAIAATKVKRDYILPVDQVSCPAVY